jgi:hypothetical protein
VLDLGFSGRYGARMQRLLPYGEPSFPTIREEGFWYVDKTALVHRMITSQGRACFLSRPRRFGKSLLCSTVAAIFEGRRELFQEIAGCPALAVDALPWEWKKHPVIKLDLNVGSYVGGVAKTRSSLKNILHWEAKKWGIVLPDQECQAQFNHLLVSACEKAGKRAVVVIDE